MNKKVMGLLLTVIMLFTVIMPTSAATSAFTDIEGKDCAEEVEILATLGIVEGINEAQYAPDRGVTRAQMATILVRLMGAEGAAAAKDIFEDVPVDHWAYDYVSLAYNAGLIVGMGDGTFAPEEHVTYAQMVKMLLCAMGYDVQAEAAGGYPSGYYAKAAQLGMLAGISAEMDKAVSRGNMAIVLYNTIDLPLFDQTSYGSGAAGVYAESSDTLMSRYRDIYVAEGMISANYFTNITAPEGNCGVNEIAIGKQIFAVGTTDAEDMLGSKVKAYYKGTRTTDAEVPELITVAPAKASVSYDFVSSEISEETTAKKFVYKKDGAEKTIAIEDGATLIVNGQVMEEGVTAAAMQPAVGTVTLVCNNGGSADVVKVWSYENGIVQSTDIKRETVYFKNPVYGSASLVIDAEDKSVKTSFTDKAGESFDVTGLAKWNVLSVAKSADGKVVVAVKSTDSVMGKVTEASADAVVIGDVEYKVAQGCEQPALDTGAKYYCDFLGNIAAIDTSAVSDYIYGYLVNAAYSKGIDKRAQLKVFTQDGEMVIYDTTDKVRVNDANIANSELVENIPAVYKYTGTGTAYTKTGTSTIRQLIKYTVNGNNEVNEILTALNKTNAVNEMAGAAGFNMVLELNANGQAYYPVGVEGEAGYFDFQKTVKSSDTGEVHYVNNLGLLGANLAVDTSKTAIFRIPGTDAPDEDYQVITAVELPHRAKLAHTSAYDLTEGFALGAIVYDTGAAGVASTTGDPKYYSDMNIPAGLVVSVSKMVNQEFEAVYKIKLLDWDGNAQEVYANGDLKCAAKRANTNFEADTAIKTTEETGIPYITPADLRVGDIVRFEKNAEGYLTVADVVYRAETPGMKEYAVRPAEDSIWATTATSIYVTGDLVSSGTVSYADSNAVICETSLVDANIEPVQEVTRTYPYKSSKVFLFERDTQTYKAITSNEILVGDHCVVLWRTITPMAIFIYR